MQATLTRVHEPAKAKAYFDAKLAFTTGPVELDRMIRAGENNINIVDVREGEDFAKGHVPGATNLPREQWDSLEGLSKDKTNIVYCYNQNCHLAANAAATFAGKGYPVMELEGGFKTWKEYDFDIEHSPSDRLKRAGDRLTQTRH